MKATVTSQAILLLALVTNSHSFCPDGAYLHPHEEAGYACYKENEDDLLCDSNLEPLCTETNCLVQLGGYESYSCGHVEHYFEYLDASQELIDAWTSKCCYSERQEVIGCLAGKEVTFSGQCTYSNFLAAAADYKCSETDLFAYLEVANVTMSSQKIAELCIDATAEARESSFDFSNIAAGGYQFDREFMNGGSEWNNVFNPDLTRVQWMEDNIATTKAISFPENLHNFKPGDEGNCASNAVMCCWTSDSSDAGEGDCNDSAGCQDAEPLDNTDVCYVDIKDSFLASHTEDGYVVYPGDSEGNVNCMGFTWTDNENDPANLYKGNLLFEVAMRHGLKENGYTRSVPHAPMCACVEQMPVVSRADCKDVENVDNWSFAPDGDSGLLNLWHASANLTFNDCGGKDLAAEYEGTHNTSISDRITGDCATTEETFLHDKGYAVANSVKWVKVAGKGSYAEADNEKHTEQFSDGNPHTSYSREDFEELWATSNQILMRHCKFCASTHRYVYLKRYDDNGLPSNVDLLKMVKDNWHQHENNTVSVDFDLFSTYDDAVQDREPWLSVNSNYENVGFARDSGPDGYVYNQWNVWNEPLHGKHYGQSVVAFYVAMPVSDDLTKSS